MKFLIFLMAFFSMILAFIHICKRMGIDVIGILNRLGNKPTILLSSWVKDFTIRVKSAYVRLVIIGYGLRSQVWVEIFKLI